MSTLQEKISAQAPERLAGIRRGIEKEGLRVLPSGALALTPHPLALGSALTHPHITTDYSESQIELITGAHRGVQDCLDELTEIHQFVYQALRNKLSLVTYLVQNKLVKSRALAELASEQFGVPFADLHSIDKESQPKDLDFR